MIRRILRRLAQRRAHQAAMSKVYVGLSDFRVNKASAGWSELAEGSEAPVPEVFFEMVTRS